MTAPLNVVARYLTAGTATVDVSDTGLGSLMDGLVLDRTVWADCRGCGSRLGETHKVWETRRGEHPTEELDTALQELRETAQEHAATCRAMSLA